MRNHGLNIKIQYKEQYTKVRHNKQQYQVFGIKHLYVNIQKANKRFYGTSHILQYQINTILINIQSN